MTRPGDKIFYLSQRMWCSAASFSEGYLTNQSHTAEVFFILVTDSPTTAALIFNHVSLHAMYSHGINIWKY